MGFLRFFLVWIGGKRSVLVGLLIVVAVLGVAAVAFFVASRLGERAVLGLAGSLLVGLFWVARFVRDSLREAWAEYSQGRARWTSQR